MDYLTKYYKNLCEQLEARLALLEAAAKKAKKGKELDPVGEEDGDIDNDGDEDNTDDYLLKRREAVGKAIRERNK